MSESFIVSLWMMLTDCYLAASDAQTEKSFVNLLVEERNLFLCSFP